MPARALARCSSAAYVGGMPVDEMERRALVAAQARPVPHQPRRHAARAHAVAVDLSRRAAARVMHERRSERHVRSASDRRCSSTRWTSSAARRSCGDCRVFANVRVDDAVYASCALPGFFPPGRVDGRLCIDGGTIDNLPVAIAAQHADAVIAVDVGSSDLSHNTDATAQGFAATYMRAATVMMHALQLSPLREWSGPPMFLIRPRLGHVGWLSFSHTSEVIAEGYRAASEALTHLPECLAAKSGVSILARAYRLDVDRESLHGMRVLRRDRARRDGDGRARQSVSEAGDRRLVLGGRRLRAPLPDAGDLGVTPDADRSNSRFRRRKWPEEADSHQPSSRNVRQCRLDGRRLSAAVIATRERSLVDPDRRPQLGDLDELVIAVGHVDRARAEQVGRSPIR